VDQSIEHPGLSLPFFFLSTFKKDISIVDVSSSDICDEDREKRDDARSILKMNTMDLSWFMPSQRVIALHPDFIVLHYEFRCPRWIAGCYFYNLHNHLIDMAGTLLQLT
jgi:hypothetical protein